MPTTPASAHIAAPASLIDSPQAAWRLLTTLGLVVLGNSSMYVVSVVLPAVQAEFGVGRADASLPYTLMMVCLGLGGLWTGRMADRHGLMPVLCVGAVAVCGGFVWAGLSGSIWIFGLAHGLMGLVGSSATFAPLMADTALWWNRRRGIAVAICASGNYIAGALWPPIVQHGIEAIGWRQTYVLMGLGCGVGLLLFLLLGGLVPLYVISAMFGLFQGGIVPAYAIIIREYFAPQEAGARVGAVIMATLIGMALGGWMSGWIFDVTGSYQAAFINGMGGNLLNLSIMGWLYWRGGGPGAGWGGGAPRGGRGGDPHPARCGPGPPSFPLE